MVTLKIFTVLLLCGLTVKHTSGLECYVCDGCEEVTSEDLQICPSVSIPTNPDPEQPPTTTDANVSIDPEMPTTTYSPGSTDESTVTDLLTTTDFSTTDDLPSTTDRPTEATESDLSTNTEVPTTTNLPSTTDEPTTGTETDTPSITNEPTLATETDVPTTTAVPTTTDSISTTEEPTTSTDTETPPPNPPVDTNEVGSPNINGFQDYSVRMLRNGNTRYSRLMLRDEEVFEPRCVVTTYREANGETNIIRGCGYQSNDNEARCKDAIGTNFTGELITCNVCNSPHCNSAANSMAAIMLIALSVFINFYN